MDHALAILQGLLLFAALSVPGLVVFGGSGWRARLPLLLAVSFMACALAVTALAVVAARLWPSSGVMVVAWGWVGVAASLLVLRAKLLVWVFRRIGSERWSLVAAGAVALSWLALAPLSPYPGQVNLNLGDAPSYCCAARALLNGHHGRPGYFATDYLSGRPSYLSAHPVPVAAMAFQFALFGRGSPAPLSFNILASFLLILLLSDVANPKPATSGGLTNVWFTLGFILLPSHFLHWGLGLVTANGTLGFAAIAAGLLSRELPARQQRLVVALGLGYMFLSRPEAALLVAALGLVGAVWALAWLWARKPRLAAPFSVLAVGLVFVVFWWKLPTVVGTIARRAPSLSFLHLGYDEASGRFRALHEPPWELNRGYCRQNLNPGAPKTEPCNPRVGEEIRAHPVAFLAWLLGRFGQTALYFVRAVSVAQWEFRPLAGVPAVALVVALMLLAMLARGAAPFVVAAALVVVALPAANRMAHVRHLLLVSPVVLALGVRAVWTRWGDRLAALAGRRWFMVVAGAGLSLLAFLDCRSIIRVRTYWPNRCYEHLLADIERVAAPGDLVAPTSAQLVAQATGRRCVGGTWVTENLSGLVAMWRPEVVVVDDFNEVARNYEKLMETGGHLAGYEPVVHNRRERYIVFRRKD